MLLNMLKKEEEMGTYSFCYATKIVYFLNLFGGMGMIILKTLRIPIVQELGTDETIAQMKYILLDFNGICFCLLIQLVLWWLKDLWPLLKTKIRVNATHVSPPPPVYTTAALHIYSALTITCMAILMQCSRWALTCHYLYLQPELEQAVTVPGVGQ